MLNTIPLPRRANALAAGAFAVLLLTCAVGLTPLAAAQLWKEGSNVQFEQPQPPAFIEAAKALKPAVVNISSRRTAPTEERRVDFAAGRFPSAARTPSRNFSTASSASSAARAIAPAWAPASSSTPTATSSPTTTWWRRPTKSP